MEPCYLIEFEKYTPAINMAYDEKLMDWCRNEGFPPVLRFYGWNPPGLTLGFFQKTKDKIDIAKTLSYGIDIVRRPTGGQAVLHDKELTYSFICSESQLNLPKSIKDSHRIISLALLKGLEQVGINADIAEPEDKKTSGTAICFEEPSWYEITMDNKKAIGSAQTRQNGVMLEHGSIPIDTDESRLFDLFIFKDERTKQRLLESFSTKATSIFTETGKKYTEQELAVAFQKGFKEIFDLNFSIFKPTEKQWLEIKTLAKNKYEDPTYTYQR